MQCQQEILEADRIGDEEEDCLLRDHLLAVHFDLSGEGGGGWAGTARTGRNPT